MISHVLEMKLEQMFSAMVGEILAVAIGTGGVLFIATILSQYMH